jgi:hypothetical protein
MSKSNLHETAYLKLLFQNIAMQNVGNAAGIQPSGVAGNLYLALFLTNPDEDGSGTEATFINYARQPVARSVVGWTVNGNVVSNASLITFPASGGTDNTITFFAIMTAASGGDLIGSGTLNSLILTNTDVAKFQAGDITITED